MTTIWKYELIVTDEQMVAMPAGAEVLCVQVQRGVPRAWVLVDPEAPLAPTTFIIHGTGHCVERTDLRYVGTFQLYDGAFVGHAFIVEAAPR